MSVPDVPLPVKKAVDLAALAKRDDLVLIAVPKVVGDVLATETGAVTIRLENHPDHPRLRKMVIRPLAAPTPKARGKKGAQQGASVKKFVPPPLSSGGPTP